ncbi:signal recognition particle-docking protein FtsY [Lactiplantibacillus fabifermentans]|uniref:Signal recognition particle receptor FtsY n=2 Tax=Lactiplantibacillus fabifermentans TaxID=483011 RepID=A0A0R2NSH2_9LACO|nr:signal recognition particle-docking protein FtsY [Lactiplantibacillus fabifermentans]ETY74554.1 cell division protein FtsY [Lactiplantibacillus fabifermentans T30PCM01]KRO27691.1 cell division protein FtsY [Lactiplantibacillus fabifermentans DSM 21115]
MGLFSRLKKAFSLPESDESAAADTSQAAESTASQAEAGTSDSTATATTSEQPVESTAPAAESDAPVESAATSTAVESSASETVAASEPAISEATASEAAVSAAADSEVDAVASEAPVTSEAPVAESETTSEAPETVTKEAASVAESEAPAAESTATTDDAATTDDEPTEAERYDQGLKKSRKTFGDRINAFLANFRHVDENFFDELEDTLIESDVGYETAMRISDELRDEVKLKNAKSKKEISSVIVEKLVDMYGEAGEGEDNSIHMAKSGPTVILFVGVNGAGKTTTIGKMANMYKQQGKKVLLAACDTFRAGAIQQLQVWGQRDGVDVVAGPEKSDPASVCFDAVKKAKAEDYDILFVDTAGRLQNKVNLMNELEKIKRVITREIPDAPQEVLLVLDATTGQNALNQAKIFNQSTDVTGIVLTKLDGTARGGIVLAIRNELHLVVKYVGLGEKVTDLRPFNANDFVYGLFKDIIAG